MRLCPWSLALASSIPVLGLESVCPRKGCPWPWPRIFYVSLALASSLVSSTPPLVAIHQGSFIINRYRFSNQISTNKIILKRPVISYFGFIARNFSLLKGKFNINFRSLFMMVFQNFYLTTAAYETIPSVSQPFSYTHF